VTESKRDEVKRYGRARRECRVRKKEENVPKTTISFGRPKPMAINSVNRGIDENHRVSDVFPRICGWER